MKFTCPHCPHRFLPEDINPVTNLALCPECGQVTELSEPGDADSSPKEIPHPPKGAWYRETMTGCVFGATTRSADAIVTVLFACGWSGFPLGIFYGVQILTGKFSLMLSLLGVPFLLGSFFPWALALMQICGKVEVRMADGSGAAFVGVGRLGWRAAFNLDEVASIENSLLRKSRRGEEADECIVLRGQRTIGFGRMLTGSRQHYMVKVLRYLKARRGIKP